MTVILKALLWNSQNIWLEFTRTQRMRSQHWSISHQASSHYLNQFWPRPVSPYGVTMPQWVNSFLLCLCLPVCNDRLSCRRHQPQTWNPWLLWSSCLSTSSSLPGFPPPNSGHNKLFVQADSKNIKVSYSMELYAGNPPIVLTKDQ